VSIIAMAHRSDGRWDTRVGSIDSDDPEGPQGERTSHQPLLEPRRRSEKALLNVVTESYVLGVSTRKVERLVEQLGLQGISRSQVSEIAKQLDETVEDFRSRPLTGRTYPFVWLDALVIKIRRGGRVVNAVVVVATGTSNKGFREILGLDVFAGETEAAWLDFLRSLVNRGLSKGTRHMNQGF
jgi:putative transposase